MASLNQFTARARQIAESRGIDPFKSPIIDAGMGAEALVPHCIRFAFTKASNDDVLDTAVDQAIEMTGELGALPDTVLRGHLDNGYLPDIPHSSPIDYPDWSRSRFDNMLCYWSTRGATFYSNCTPSNGTLFKTVLNVTKELSSDDVAYPGIIDPTFVALTDTGLRAVIVAMVGEVETVVVNALVKNVHDTATMTLWNYTVGGTDTTVADGTLYLYDPGLELTRSGTCTRSGGGQIVIDQEGSASVDDVGRLAVIYELDGITVRIRAAIDSFIDSGDFTIVGYPGIGVTPSPHPFEVYRIMDPKITLNTPSIPIMPSDPAAEIPLTSKLTDDAILILAGCLTGEISIRLVLGLEEVKESE